MVEALWHVRTSINKQCSEPKTKNKAALGSARNVEDPGPSVLRRLRCDRVPCQCLTQSTDAIDGGAPSMTVASDEGFCNSKEGGENPMSPCCKGRQIAPKDRKSKTSGALK